jgi:hypothetical protein
MEVGYEAKDSKQPAPKDLVCKCSYGQVLSALLTRLRSLMACITARRR